MLTLLLQAFAALLIAFLIGLPIGDGLARLFRRKVHVHATPVAVPEPEILPSEPAPVITPPPAIKPWSDALVFPVSSFGITVKCCPLWIERTAPRALTRSPLADLPPAEQHALLARTRFSLEPECLWGADGVPDDLTGIDGLTAEDARRLNALGVFHLWQIAQWQPSHVLWVARRLPSPQRIVTGNWIGRAAVMATPV